MQRPARPGFGYRLYFESLSETDAPAQKIALYVYRSRSLRRNDIDIIVLNTVRNLILADGVTRSGLVLVDWDRSFRRAYEVSIQHQAMDFFTQRRRLVGI